MESIFLLFVAVALLVLGLTVLQSWSRHQRERLQVVERALRDDAVDAEAKTRMIALLDPPSKVPRLLFGGGWVMLFFGIGLLLADERDTYVAGTILLAVGFGLVTLPIAYREYEARRSST